MLAPCPKVEERIKVSIASAWRQTLTRFRGRRYSFLPPWHSSASGTNCRTPFIYSPSVFSALIVKMGYEEHKLAYRPLDSGKTLLTNDEDDELSDTFHTMRIVCLANSLKYSGRCVAGKELTEGQIGRWVRPVNGTPTKELSLSDITLQTGNEPKLLDVISVPLGKTCPLSYQSENWSIERAPWIWEGTLPLAEVSRLCDDAEGLWINGYHGLHGANDLMPEGLVQETIDSSLVLIRPEDLQIVVGPGLMGAKKIHARFNFRDETYLLTVTDPVMKTHYMQKDLGEYAVDSAQTLLTVSISDPNRGFCHKLVAGIIL